MEADLKEKHSCNICELVLTSKSNLQQHISTHTGERHFPCPSCPLRFLRRNVLHRHKEAAHNSNRHRNFECGQCQRKFFDVIGLKAHLRTHNKNTDRPFPCNGCNLSFKTKEELESHKNTPDFLNGHSSSKLMQRPESFGRVVPPKSNQPQICIFCGKENFYRPVYLEMHIRGHIWERPFFCSVCPFDASTVVALRSHLNTHNDNRKTFKCDLCEKCFISDSGLRGHKKVHSGEKLHSCNICERHFLERSDLNQHIIGVHTREKEGQYPCPSCDKRYSTVGHLNFHVKKFHNPNQTNNFKCDQCMKSFYRESELNAHLQVHTGLKLFQCQLCAYKTTRMGNLKSHVAKVHTPNRKKEHQCKLCSRLFFTVCELKQHAAVHITTKDFKCGLYSNSYKGKRQLNDHHKKIHPEQQCVNMPAN